VAGQGVRTVIGLQARQASAIAFVRKLLSDGYVGEVSTTMVGLSVPGGVVVQPNAYMLDRNNGANALTIAVGHSLDALSYVLGEFAALSAVSELRRPLITIEETGEQIVKTAADQIAVIGTLASGATVSIHVREAVAGGTGFLWEINGADGTLRITAGAPYPGIFPLTVAGAQGSDEPAELAIPAALTQKWPELTNLQGTPAYNVGRVYAASLQTSGMRLMSFPTSPTRCLVTRSSTLLSGLRHRGNASSLRRLDHARKFREVAELVAGEGEDTGYNPTAAALAVLGGHRGI